MIKVELRPRQIPPKDYDRWELLTECRAVGTTFAAAHEVVRAIEAKEVKSVALAGPDFVHVKHVMLRAIEDIWGFRLPNFQPAHTFVMVETRVRILSADPRSAGTADGLEFDMAWRDEVTSGNQPQFCARLGSRLRMGPKPRLIVSATV